MEKITRLCCWAGPVATNRVCIYDGLEDCKKCPYDGRPNHGECSHYEALIQDLDPIPNTIVVK